MEGQGGSTGGIRGFFERMRHAPLWVWLTVLLTAGLLVFAYLQYKKTAGSSGSTTTTSAGLGTIPTDGSGQPLWSTADTSGMLSGNMTDLQALLAYLQSTQTPNAPTTATPVAPVTRPTLPNRPIVPAPQRPGQGGILPPATTGGFWSPRLRPLGGV